MPAQNLELPAELDRADLDYLFSVTYEELRRLAASVRRRHPAATLNPTALVHEAWLKLAGSPAFVATSRLHFKRIAARAMRQLLVESARRRSSKKRGGPEAFVTFDEAIETQGPDHVNVGIVEEKLGHSLLRQLRYKEAEEYTLAGYRNLAKQASPSASWLQWARKDLGEIYTALNEPEKATKFLAEREAVAAAAQGPAGKK